MPHLDDSGQRPRGYGNVKYKKGTYQGAAKKRVESKGSGYRENYTSPTWKVPEKAKLTGSKPYNDRKGSAYPSSSEYRDIVRNYKRGVQTKTLNKGTEEAMQGYRNDRARRGIYKGKYYGPDQFKGDLNMVDAWRKAGSPKDVKGFYKKNRKSVTPKQARNTGRGD